VHELQSVVLRTEGPAPGTVGGRLELDRPVRTGEPHLDLDVARGRQVLAGHADPQLTVVDRRGEGAGAVDLLAPGGDPDVCLDPVAVAQRNRAVERDDDTTQRARRQLAG